MQQTNSDGLGLSFVWNHHMPYLIPENPKINVNPEYEDLRSITTKQISNTAINKKKIITPESSAKGMAQFRGEGDSRCVGFVDARTSSKSAWIWKSERRRRSPNIYIFNWVRVSIFNLRSADV